MTLIELREMCAKICDKHHNISASLAGSARAKWCAEDIRAIQLPVEQSRKDFATSDGEGGFKDLISQFRKAAWERDMDEMLRIQKFIFDLVENELLEQEPAKPTVNNSLTVVALEKQVEELKLSLGAAIQTIDTCGISFSEESMKLARRLLNEY